MSWGGQVRVMGTLGVPPPIARGALLQAHSLPGANCSLLGLHVEWDEARCAGKKKAHIVWSFLD